MSQTLGSHTGTTALKRQKGYAFATVHIHGAIYKESGLLTSEGKTIKNKSEILQLLEAVWAPQRLATIHCQGHQKGNDELAAGNCLADHAAKAAAQDTDVAIIASTTPVSPTPTYTTAEDSWVQNEGATWHPQGWWILRDGRLFISAALTPRIILEHHSTSHLGKTGLEKLRAKNFYIARLAALCRAITERCATCARHNPKTGSTPPPGIQRMGSAPFEGLEVDFKK
ncbi:hypothetical protein mRhiFer1_009052 [Rhinolophus ferrumequinum]|uniref:RNase H type-1 domain-containing protein n=1 Tax=Rhinolophus ferrumequinum TaxID=59479 RepID=A0A7J7SXL0_RHIFE|nr:hypothetical protein mRhiFer1_009052 [Rhinolophus ferrumequinum]